MGAVKIVILWLCILSVGCSVETDPAQYDAAVDYCGGSKKVHVIKFEASRIEGYVDEIICKDGTRFNVFINNFALENEMYD